MTAEKAQFKDLFVDGKCLICHRPLRKHRGSFGRRKAFVFWHRQKEKRDCVFYEECLTRGALADEICLPCSICEAYEKET